MKYILTMVLFVFSLGLYAETLPVSVTNDNDISHNSIDDDFDVISVADYVQVVPFEFYDDVDSGNSFTHNEGEKATALIQVYLPVNDVGKQIEKDNYILNFGFHTQTPLTPLVYRRSRDGLMCFSAK